jgi:hypothetical protein
VVKITTLIKNADVRTLTKGILVSRAAAALPSSTLGNIFTISGGRVLIVSLTGSVATLLSGTNSTTIGVTPTGGASAPAVLSSAGIIPVAAGSPLISNLAGGALSVVVSGGVIAATPFLALAGVVTITTASTVTGTVSWELIYVPLDVAAQVVAA